MTLPPFNNAAYDSDDEIPLQPFRRPRRPTLPTRIVRPVPTPREFEIETIDDPDSDELSDASTTEEVEPTFEDICEECEAYKNTCIATAFLVLLYADPPAPRSILSPGLMRIMEHNFRVYDSITALRLDMATNVVLANNLLQALKHTETMLMDFVVTNPGVRAQFTAENWDYLTVTLRPNNRPRDEEDDEEDLARPRQRRRTS